MNERLGGEEAALYFLNQSSRGGVDGNHVNRLNVYVSVLSIKKVKYMTKHGESRGLTATFNPQETTIFPLHDRQLERNTSDVRDLSEQRDLPLRPCQ